MDVDWKPGNDSAEVAEIAVLRRQNSLGRDEESADLFKGRHRPHDAVQFRRVDDQAEKGFRRAQIQKFGAEHGRL